MTDDLIEVNVAGRLMLLLSKRGLLDNRRLSIYRRAVSDAVRVRLDQQPGGGSADLKSLLDGQLMMLEMALSARPSDTAGQEVASPTAFSGVEGRQDTDGVSPGVDADSPASRSLRRARPPSGYVPTAKTLEEKLKDARRPVQTLLREDCVRIGLIDANGADRLILSMTGKTSEQAEQDIVEQLRQVLQDQVKSFIRKAKDGPCSDPRTQEDLRKDIHAAKSVRSILMMTRQAVKEHQTWQEEHRRGGILGLFSPRRRIVERP